MVYRKGFSNFENRFKGQTSISQITWLDWNSHLHFIRCIHYLQGDGEATKKMYEVTVEKPDKSKDIIELKKNSIQQKIISIIEKSD